MGLVAHRSKRQLYVYKSEALTCFSLFVFKPSRLCTAGIPRRPHAQRRGRHEVTGDRPVGRRARRPEGSRPAQDGDPNGGRAAAGRSPAQAQTARHEHPDALRLLDDTARHVCPIAGHS